MKLAISNIAWLSGEDSTVYNMMQKFGYQGLEIAPTRFFPTTPYQHCKQAKKTQENLWQNYQFNIVSMQSLLFGTEGLNLFTTPEARAKLKDYLKEAIVFAGTIDCKVLVFGNPKNRISHNPDKDLKIAETFFSELGDFAAIHNVCLCLEPNPEAYGTNFMTTTQETYAFVKQCNSPGFKMICDAGAMIINQERPEDVVNWLDACMHIHISAPFLAPIVAKPEYQIHYQKLIQVLKEANYAHYLSIEMARPKDNTLEKISACLQFLSEVAHGV